MEFKYPQGATPLSPEALLELIPMISTQSELNQFEHTNIQSAWEWAIKSRKLKNDLLTIEGIKLLHNKMFDFTWKWAGKFRQYDTNLGEVWYKVPEELKKLCDDVQYWDQHQTFQSMELAVRFHHRLVSIHPFPNGNGRLSRLCADLYLQFRKLPKLSWGGSDGLVNDSSKRREYLAALGEADMGKYSRLIDFAIGKGS